MNVSITTPAPAAPIASAPQSPGFQRTSAAPLRAVPQAPLAPRVAPRPPQPLRTVAHADVATISAAAHQILRTTGVDDEGTSHQVNDQGSVVS